MPQRTSNLCAGAGIKAPIKFSFPPIVVADARLLVLGTLPGEESLRRQQYYGHKHNAFWRLICAVFGKEPPAAYADREALLRGNRFALWDVLMSAERMGSSDAAIRNACTNDFAQFFGSYPSIKAIAFNGQKAEALFKRHVLKPGIVPEKRFRMLALPSSSPLYTLPFEKKLAMWQTELAEFASKSRGSS
jgi:hypoxanthine-DNA glycosylase